MVAVAQTWTRASRTPVITTAIARGSSTELNTLPSLIPIPRAASTAPRSTSSTPV